MDRHHEEWLFEIERKSLTAKKQKEIEREKYIKQLEERIIELETKIQNTKTQVNER